MCSFTRGPLEESDIEWPVDAGTKIRFDIRVSQRTGKQEACDIKLIDGAETLAPIRFGEGDAA